MHDVQPCYTSIEQVPYGDILAGDGALVGYRILRDKNAPICDNTCDSPLAPGSSPHSHPKVVGFLLFAERGYAEVDASTGLVMAAGVTHPFPSAS